MPHELQVKKGRQLECTPSIPAFPSASLESTKLCIPLLTAMWQCKAVWYIEQSYTILTSAWYCSKDRTCPGGTDVCTPKRLEPVR